MGTGIRLMNHLMSFIAKTNQKIVKLRMEKVGLIASLVMLAHYVNPAIQWVLFGVKNLLR
jgi:hypothetical protein